MKFPLLDMLFRVKHVLWRENRIQLLLRKNIVFEDEIINRTTSLEGFLGNLCAVLVTDVRVQSGYNPDRMLHHL